MVFSDRIKRISESATLAMTAKAAELRTQGIKVINLSVGGNIDPYSFVLDSIQENVNGTKTYYQRRVNGIKT